MSAEVAAHGPARVALPSIPDYLRATAVLGRRSLRPALPALAFLYFYRLGMGAYMAFSDTSSFPQGRDALAAVAPRLMVLVSFLPLLLLVYTPFLPLQDSLLRGQEMSFRGAIRRVLETAWNFMLSGIIQFLVFVVPLTLVFAIAGIMTPASAVGAMNPMQLLPIAFAFLASIGWFLLAGFFMIFATPAVVLDGEGPLQSLRTSVRLVSENLGSVLGRFFVFVVLSVIFYMLASMPVSMLGILEQASGLATAPVKIATVIWSSAVDTIFLPFMVAALMVLYRALVPPARDSRAGAPVTLDEEFQPATAARAPFE